MDLLALLGLPGSPFYWNQEKGIENLFLNLILVLRTSRLLHFLPNLLLDICNINQKFFCRYKKVLRVIIHEKYLHNNT